MCPGATYVVVGRITVSLEDVLEVAPKCGVLPSRRCKCVRHRSADEFCRGTVRQLDCLVNNAGVSGEGGPIAETSVEGFNQSIALLLGGPFLGIKYAVPRMQSGGTIINIASVASLVGGYGTHAYTAAKFGVVGLTKSVALELAERGIRVKR
jgi:NAD(P)-dependent dehydrogenase (short-subunit alcohol dehydrogenase family)